MSKTPAVKVVQPAAPEPEIPTEVLAQSIADLAAAMQKIQAGRLGKKALVMLVAEAAGVGRGDTQRVLDVLPELERIYLRPKPDIKLNLPKAARR